MNTLKTLLTFLLAGAFVGGALGSWLGPKYIAWDNTATFATQTVCDLPTVVGQVADKLLRTQLYSALAGALVFLVFGIFFVRARNARRARTGAAPVPPPTTPTVAR